MLCHQVAEGIEHPLVERLAVLLDGVGIDAGHQIRRTEQYVTTPSLEPVGAGGRVGTHTVWFYLVEGFGLIEIIDEGP